MSDWQMRYRRWKHGRLFARLGGGVQFLGKRLEVKGHVELGDRCIIHENVVLRTHRQGKLLFGDEVEIADNALIQCNARFEAGSGTRIGEHVVIRDTDHVMRGTDAHWRLTPHITEAIVIGPGCYIGPHVYIGRGVRIGEGAAIAPGSVITKEVGPWEIWAGYPAMRVAHRTEKTLFSSLRRHLDLVAMFGVTAPADEETA